MTTIVTVKKPKLDGEPTRPGWYEDKEGDLVFLDPNHGILFFPHLECVRGSLQGVRWRDFSPYTEVTEFTLDYSRDGE